MKSKHLKTGPSDVLAPYLQSVSLHDRITAEQEISLARAWRDCGDADARNRMIAGNLRLVIALAKRYAGRGTPLEDLIAEGNIGLVKAVDNFNPEVGCRFSTYAIFWIRRSIGDAFQRNSGKPHLSREDRGSLVALENAENRFQAAHGRSPTQEELSALLGWSASDIRGCQGLKGLRVTHKSLSDSTLSSTLRVPPSSPSTPAECTAVGDKERILKELALGLPESQRRTLELTFGLDGGGARTIATVATILNEPPRMIKARLEMAIRSLTRRCRTSSSLNGDESDTTAWNANAVLAS